MAFDDDWDPDREEEQDYFDAKEARQHLLIIRAFDAPRYYRTENNQDGMVYPNKSRGQTFEPFPNMVVRCAVADLDADEGHGKVYPEAVLFPSSITKVAKMWVGKGPQLVMWRKGDGQTDPYELRNMRGDEQAVKAGKQFLDEHPEFMELKPPEPYDERPPSKDRDRSGHDSRNDYARDEYRRSRDDGWGDREPRTTRRRDEGEWEYRRPSFRDGRDSERPRYRDDRDRAYDSRYDDRGRQERPSGFRDRRDEESWARPRSAPPSQRDDRDGSFLNRSRNHHGDFQDEEIPF